jgi:N-acetylmuramoyl-L-alanine amidase
MARRSRSDRLEHTRVRRKRVYILSSLGVVAVSALVIGIALGVAGARVADQPTIVDVQALEPAVETSALASAESSASGGILVEMPNVVGPALDAAGLLLELAGFEVALISTPPGEATTGTVLAQTPTAGVRVASGSVVELVWADPASSATVTGSQSAATVAAGSSARSVAVVCIDPGHQAQANTGLEPIGPGATETKAKVTGGATGVVTRQAEHAITLAISLKVQQRLEARGVRVVMTRTAADVDISNSQRAAVANDAGADLFVRVHADSSTNADIRGVSTLVPAGNSWVAPIESPSLAAAEAIHSALLAATGAPDRGIVQRADLSGFNWATVPAVLVETGFLSNPTEDRLLADPAYQDQIADGIARGVLAYLGL